MMKDILKLIPILLVLLVLTSCDKKNNEDNISEYSLGEAVYYPSFLWSDEKLEPIEKNMTLDFNDDAKEAQSSATLLFVDENNNPINSSEIEIRANGKPLENGKLNISSELEEMKIEIYPNKSQSGGIKSGYILLKDSYNLDRIVDADGDKILKWNFRYTIKMNPVAHTLMWIGIILGCGLVLWFAILKRMFFPVFGTMTKTITFPNAAPIVMRFKGCRKIVLDSIGHKQGGFDRIFKGKISYYKSTGVTSPFEFLPSGTKKGIVRADFSKYAFSATTFNKIGGEIIITDLETNSKIIIR